MNKKRPRGRPPSKDPARGRIHFRCTPAEKLKYEAAARRDGVVRAGGDPNLSAWLKGLADRESS